MRARNIKPGFYRNEDLAECSFAARLLFPGLWMLADRMGRLEYRPKRWKGEIFPYDNVDTVELFAELETHGLVKSYESAGIKYVWIPKFSAHQIPHHREKESLIPPHPEDLGYHETEDGPDGMDTDPGTTQAQPRYDLGHTHARPCPGPAQGQPTTSPGPAQGKAQPRHGLAHLNPDILNPDILNPDILNPECSLPESEDARTHARVNQATEPDPPKKKPAAKKVEPDKRQFGECGNVRLTLQELEKLNEQYGVDATGDAITFLDQHIGAKGKDPYASHYLALKKWVFTAVEEKRRRTEGRSHRPGTGQARVITGDKVLDANIATAEAVLRSRAEGGLENGQVC